MPDRTGVENEGGPRPYLFEHCDGKGGDGRFVWQPGAEKHDISPIDIWHQLQVRAPGRPAQATVIAEWVVHGASPSERIGASVLVHRICVTPSF